MSSGTVSPLLPFALALLGDLNFTVGVMVIYGILTGTIFGITSVQTLVYFNTAQKDGTLLRRTIFALWILDLLQTVMFSHAVYSYTTVSLSDPELYITFLWSASVHLVAGALNNLVVTIIFTYRIWKFGHSIWPWIVVLPPAVASLVGFVALAAVCLLSPSIIILYQKYTWLGYAVYSTQAFSDIVIMVSVIVTLLRRRSRVARTNSVISSLIFYGINTCILTTSVSVATIITVAFLPHTYIPEGLGSLVPKLLLNSLLATLNSRDHMRKKLLSDAPLSMQLSQDTESGTQPRNMMASRDIPIQFNRGASYSPGSKKIDSRASDEVVDIHA